MLTTEQRAEGRRLLAIAQTLTRSEVAETYAPFDDWLRLHAPALLAEPPAIDVEAIKRAAVREFAKKLLSFQRKVRVGTEYFQVVLVSGIRAACTARGANLNDKP